MHRADRRIVLVPAERFRRHRANERREFFAFLGGRVSSGMNDTIKAAPSAAVLVNTLGGRFSKSLGIDLACGEATETFKWFLAAMLFGARISEVLAVRTFHALVQAGLTTPQRILDRGWEGLVTVLDRGGYVRYDFKTATKLLEVAGRLVELYGGDLTALHAAAENPRDLEQRLRTLGRGIGEVTVNIFLREMRGLWDKADPLPSALVLDAARSHRFIPASLADGRVALQLLMAQWLEEGMAAGDFPDFEAALLRSGLRQRRSTGRRSQRKRQS